MNSSDRKLGFNPSNFEGKVTLEEIVGFVLKELGVDNVIPGEPVTGASVQLVRTPIGVGNATIVTAQQTGTAALESHSHRFKSLTGTVNGMSASNLQDALDDISTRLRAIEVALQIQ